MFSPDTPAADQTQSHSELWRVSQDRFIKRLPAGLATLYQVGPGPACLAPVTFGRVVVPIIRGITIGLSSMRLVAEDFGRRGSPSKFARRGTPFGQPSLST